MFHDSPNWAVMGEPALKAEAAVLDRFRDPLPEDRSTRVRANLTFIDEGGRIGEIDVLPFTRQGPVSVSVARGTVLYCPIAGGKGAQHGQDHRAV